MKEKNDISHYGEKWKNVYFSFEHTNDYRLEVSNFGRVRSFNKLSNGNILKGSITEGYKIIRLKFFKTSDDAAIKQTVKFEKQISIVSKKIKRLKEEGESDSMINLEKEALNKLKKKLSKHLAQNTKERTIHYHSLIHRLVATYFLPIPPLTKTIVAHLDFDKPNNAAVNLKWMTPEENYIHQRNSPFVLKEKERRVAAGSIFSKNTKLTVTKVMLLKKMLNENRKTVKQLAKQFKVSDMQIIRIRRGENWSTIPAAE